MSKLWKLFLMILTVAACSEEPKSAKNLTINGTNGEKAAYNVELAKTPDEMRTGLMNRESLPADAGMIFDLSEVNLPTAMWMKDTKIALDMLFLDKDGTIYWIYENAEPYSTKLIIAPYQATAVLEINGGEAKKHGIEIGDTVQHDLFKKKETAAEKTEETPAETTVAEPVEAPAETPAEATSVEPVAAPAEATTAEPAETPAEEKQE